MSFSSSVKHEAVREVNWVAGTGAAASIHVLSGAVSPMYSSSATIKNEAHGEAEWVASTAPSVHVAEGAVSPSTSRHEGLGETLTHKNVTFIFVIAVVLSLAIFIATYCIAYIIWCMMLRPRERNPHDYAYRSRVAAAAAAVTMESAERGIAYGGLEATLVSSFPILKYRATEEMKGAENLQRNEECAVCLSEFEAGEEMKVLPVCRHGFHKACIDRWLLSHTTCPICRLSLVKRIQGGHGNNSR